MKNLCVMYGFTYRTGADGIDETFGNQRGFDIDENFVVLMNNLCIMYRFTYGNWC